MENPTLPQNPKPNFVIWIAAGVVILSIGIGLGLGLALGKYSPLNSPPASSQITSYEECVNAKGSIVTESYPAACITTSGQRFIQQLSDEEKQSLQPPDQTSEPTDSNPTAG